MCGPATGGGTDSFNREGVRGSVECMVSPWVCVAASGAHKHKRSDTRSRTYLTEVSSMTGLNISRWTASNEERMVVSRNA